MRALRWTARAGAAVDVPPPAGPRRMGGGRRRPLRAVRHRPAHLLRPPPPGRPGARPRARAERHPRRRAATVAGSLPAGTPVVVNPLLPCGHCATCLAGRPHTCANLQLLGIDAPGGAAEQVAVPEGSLVPLPADADLDAAAFAEPLAVAVRAVRRSRLALGEDVVVVGAGPVGLAVALCARQAGAASVLVLETAPARREVAAAARPGRGRPFQGLRTTPGRPGRRGARGVRLRLAPRRGGPARRPRRTRRPRRGGRDLPRPHADRPAGRLVQGARGDRHAGVLPGRPAHRGAPDHQRRVRPPAVADPRRYHRRGAAGDRRPAPAAAT